MKQKQQIDIDKLKQEVDCIDLAYRLGMNVSPKTEKYATIPCPGHERRIGRADNNQGNCILYRDGYICHACDPGVKHDAIDITMEFLNCSFIDAVNTIVDMYGGKKYFTSNQGVEKLPLSNEDLSLIGLKPSGKLFMPINGASKHIEPEHGIYVEKIGEEFIFAETPASFSLLNLKRDDEEAFNMLIAFKAYEALQKYQRLLEEYGSRTAAKASIVYDLFYENGGVDESTFYGIKNALQRKISRTKEIYNTFRKKCV